MLIGLFSIPLPLIEHNQYIAALVYKQYNTEMGMFW